MKHSSDSERGQAIVILALMMIVLLAFASLAIDGGNAYVERRRSQNAADAAALAGARQLWIQLTEVNDQGEKNNSETDLLKVINQAAESNGIAAGPSASDNPNVIAHYTTNLEGTEITSQEVGAYYGIPDNAKGIQVQASRQFATFVGGFLNQSPAASAQATAVIIPPTGCGNWAIYANASQSCPPAHVSISGGGQDINVTNGGVYSDGDMACNTSKATVSSPPGWVYNNSLQGNQCTDDPPDNTVTKRKVPPPEAWNYDDFLPGGSVQAALDAKALAEGRASDYHSIGRDDTIAADGLYYLNEDARHLSIAPNVHNVTIVANGEIQFSGGIDLSPYYNGLLLFSNTSGRGVKISGSGLNWQGLIYAPHGSVDMSAAKNLSIAGSINAACVDLSGAGININYDSASCVPQRARIVLLSD